MEPMATAANLAQAYRARPEGMELISDAGGPPPVAPGQPQLPAQLPVQPPVVPTPSPTPTPAPVAAPRPVAAPSRTPVAPSRPVQPIQPPVEIPPLGSKYDDNARQDLYDSLAQKRSQNAGWEAVSNVADMNSRVGGGTPLNAHQGMVERRTNDEKTAKGDFEAGRTAMVNEHDRAVSAQDKRDAVRAALEQKALDSKTRSEDRRYLADAAKGQKDLQLSTKQDQFNEGLTTKLSGQIRNHPVYKNYLTLHGATEQARRAVENPSAYGDLSLVYSTIKGLDAQSAVKEGEVRLMQEMASLKNKLLGYTQAMADGQKLRPEQKADALNIISSMEKIAKDNVLDMATPILNQSKRAGLQENEVNPFYEAPKAAPAGSQDRKARIAQLRAELGK